MHSYRVSTRCEFLTVVGKTIYERGGNEYLPNNQKKQLEQYNGFGIVTDGTSYEAYPMTTLAVMASIIKDLPVNGDYSKESGGPLFYAGPCKFGVNSQVLKVPPEEALAMLKADLDYALLASVQQQVSHGVECEGIRGKELFRYRGFILSIDKYSIKDDGGLPEKGEIDGFPNHPATFLMCSHLSGSMRVPSVSYGGSGCQTPTYDDAVVAMKSLIDAIIDGTAKKFYELVGKSIYKLPVGDIPAE